MIRSREKCRWLAGIAFVICLAIGGVCWHQLQTSDHRDDLGQNAYARGDWEGVVTASRARLSANRDDMAALRLLARALVRLGRDSTALPLFQRLGPEAMLPDDLCLLGIALTRSGNNRGVEVWEQARSADPNHAETLFELTRAYLADDQLSRAMETGLRLASLPRWQRRGEILLGKVKSALNDPAGAVEHWQRALEYQPGEQGGAEEPIVLRKDLARALLQIGRPDEARRQLQYILPKSGERERFWLLSRAFLQERAFAEALAAYANAGSFRDENPLLPEPAAFVGSSACASCHPTVCRSQQNSRHARTFFRGGELASLKLPPASLPDPNEPSVTHALRRTDHGQIEQETQVEGQSIHAIIQYAFGSGDRGLTLIGLDQEGQPRELRLSLYRDGPESWWDLTSGHPPKPSTPAGYLGRLLSADGVLRCFQCHVTNPRVAQETPGPLTVDRGIGCEKCHGPGGNHEIAVKARFPDLAIARPTVAAGSRVVGLCAQCHSPRGQTVLRDDPVSVRFQGTTLTWSRCFTESGDALDCVTCHDPHQNVATSSTHYEARCLSCHAGAVRSARLPTPPKRAGNADAIRQTLCPINPKEGCIACHMPAVKNVIPHTSFTDHFIRVHRN
jgi:tetratricopeptide (TPR) repeat protein